MKILYHHRVGSSDGQAVHIEAIVTALRQLGHEVVVVGPASTQRAEFGADAGLIADLKRHLPSAIYELLELAYNVPAFVRLWRAYRRERPDALYERYNLFLLAGVWLRRITGLPMLLEINSPLAQERSEFSGLANRRLARWVESVTWRAADHVLPVTGVLATLVGDAGVAAERMTVIHNGVGPEFLVRAPPGDAIRQRHQIADDAVILGFSGFVREWHGLERVIDLIARSDPARALHLLVVGDGPAVPGLKDLARHRQVDARVTFVGLVPRRDMVAYVASFDVALQPQVVPYASPLKLIEYMALRRAIVAPATPNIRELLSEANAMLFDQRAPDTFQHAIDVLTTRPALRAQLGDAAGETVQRLGLTWSANAERIARLFEGLLRERAQTRASNEPVS